MLTIELEAAMLAPIPAMRKVSGQDAAPVSASAVHVANSYRNTFDVEAEKSFAEFERPDWQEAADLILGIQPWRGRHAVRFGRGGTILP